MKIPFFKKVKVDPNIVTVAFYNVENLFDTYDDLTTYDDDFLPLAEKRWTKKRYTKKLYKLGKVLSRTGKKRSGKSPLLVGLAEVENKRVLDDLIQTKHLKDSEYGYVHYDSPDERGIDVALLYKKEHFKVVDSKAHSINITVDPDNPDYTRDILAVEGDLHKERIFVIVNHWSSRREGAKETEFKRLIGAEKVIQIINDIKQKDPHAKIVVMGDFNDDPGSKSVKLMVDQCELYNPMETLLSYTRGSLNHQFKWNIFDQIFLSTNFFEHKADTFRFSKADIFDKEFLTEYKGKYKGQPFRTYVGRKYKGGYSDHFPVFIQLKKQGIQK